MMNRGCRAASVIAVLVVAGCAKSPEAIAPAYVSPTQYANWTCDQLNAEFERLSAARTQVESQQRKARTNDIVGVVLIGLPVSTLSGDNAAGEVARIKGNWEAVAAARNMKGC